LRNGLWHADCSFPGVTLTGISNRGLLLITVLVAILWGCIFAERTIVNEARRETMMVLRSSGQAVPVHYEERPQPKPRRSPTAMATYPG
jgi:hypothetical protein